MPSFASLPERKQKYIKQRLKGLSRAESARRAGYAPSTAIAAATRVENDDVRAVFEKLVQAKAPADKVAQVIADGLAAEKTEFFTKDGIVTDSRNTIAWSERRAYAELAAEYGGYVAKDQPTTQHLHLLTVMPEPVQPASQAIDIDSTASPVSEVKPQS